MISISKSSEPQSLKSFRSVAHTNWDDIHLPANQNVYDDCLSLCISDQKGLCGYTELILDASRHIDHYVRKGLDPRMTFEWSDMVAAVKDSRFGADYKDKIMKPSDYDPANKRYNCLYNPVSDNLEGVFVYYSDGSINPSDSNDIKAVKTIEVFNLNEKSLKERRRLVMESARTMKDGGIAAEDVLSVLSKGGFVSCLGYEIGLLY